MKLIISRLKEALNLKSDKELSEYLGLPPTTLNTWKKKNRTSGLNDILPKLKKEDAVFVLSGHLSTEKKRLEYFVDVCYKDIQTLEKASGIKNVADYIYNNGDYPEGLHDYLNVEGCSLEWVKNGKGSMFNTSIVGRAKREIHKLYDPDTYASVNEESIIDDDGSTPFIDKIRFVVREELERYLAGIKEEK